MRRLATEPERVDWFQVLVDLGRCGVPASSAAAAIGIPKSTVQGWKQGAEPKFADGEKLVALWVGITGKPAEAVPRLGPV
ncbi:hypothetical protein [Stenotrophomonas acidaminiphila]|uniref:hypothetical protein n=1 Tax=Stenotrophomonas acidaminiphila TaxID=128780 RepID=UPI001D9E48E8|nr:hypothetical protein [Stenotrophomonas acidaminiphila]MPS36016.1 hypothetical protein [Stenotrophomonas sp.]